MSPITHLLASWVVAAKTTDNPRDCRLVTLAGLAPDADGLGLVVDMIKNGINQTESYHYYQTYHHSLLHGIPGAVAVAFLAAAFARRRARVFLLALSVFHLHLLCDWLGSRGPEPGDVWPIFYCAPLSNHPVWLWRGQWRLDGWQNRIITLALLAWTFRIALKQGESVVGVFSRRADCVFVSTIRKWRHDLLNRRKVRP
jgi:inner membrane protein